MRILCLGDVVGDEGIRALTEGRALSRMRDALSVDLVIVNGENAAPNNGISPDAAAAIFDAGADVVTGGNHSFRQRGIARTLDDERYLLRPANYPDAAPGHGACLIEAAGRRVLVMNLAGCVFMEPVASPFDTADAILAARPSFRERREPFDLLRTYESAYLNDSDTASPDSVDAVFSGSANNVPSASPRDANGIPSRTAQTNARPSGDVSNRSSALPNRHAANAKTTLFTMISFFSETADNSAPYPPDFVFSFIFLPSFVALLYDTPPGAITLSYRSVAEYCFYSRI